MSENRQALVLRSINLPEEMDEQLRTVAFHLKRSKSDLIRWCIHRGMKDIFERIRLGSDAEIEQVNAELDAEQRGEISANERAARQADIRRLLVGAGLD